LVASTACEGILEFNFPAGTVLGANQVREDVPALLLSKTELLLWLCKC
jgi:hypothetical protein